MCFWTAIYAKLCTQSKPEIQTTSSSPFKMNSRIITILGLHSKLPIWIRIPMSPIITYLVLSLSNLNEWVKKHKVSMANTPDIKSETLRFSHFGKKPISGFLDEAKTFENTWLLWNWAVGKTLSGQGVKHNYSMHCTNCHASSLNFTPPPSLTKIHNYMNTRKHEIRINDRKISQCN